MLTLLSAIWAFLSPLLAKFGDWFKPIIKDAETTYDSLEQEAQQAAQWGSGVLAVVNNDLSRTPPEVITLIQKAFPNLSVDVLHGFIDILLNKISNVQKQIPVTFEDAIAGLQDFLRQHQNDNSFWGHISKFLAGELAILFSPETPIQKFDDSLEYIFHLQVKPHVTAVIAANAVAPPGELISAPIEAPVVEAPPIEETPAPVEEPATPVEANTAPVSEEVPETVETPAEEQTETPEPTETTPEPAIGTAPLPAIDEAAVEAEVQRRMAALQSQTPPDQPAQ